MVNTGAKRQFKARLGGFLEGVDTIWPLQMNPVACPKTPVFPCVLTLRAI
jgi:hypothetical protein